MYLIITVPHLEYTNAIVQTMEGRGFSCIGSYESGEGYDFEFESDAEKETEIDLMVDDTYLEGLECDLRQLISNNAVKVYVEEFG